MLNGFMVNSVVRILCRAYYLKASKMD
jgi:hypothetical protein